VTIGLPDPLCELETHSLTPPDIFVVIPVHNRVGLTEECLDSLSRQTSDEFKIVVVDDGSTDGTSDMIFHRFPCVHVLSGDGSLWWTAAVNLGIEYSLAAGANYIVTLNDDTIFAPDMIEVLSRYGRHDTRLIQGAAAYDRAGEGLVYGALRADWLRGNFRWLEPTMAHDSPLQPSEILCGRGLWIPVRAFRDVGLFAEDQLPQALADYEFTQRAARVGYSLAINHEARVLLGAASISSHQPRRRDLPAFVAHLTSMTGSGNLKFFVRYAYMVAPKGARSWFAFIGVARRLIGFWLPSSRVIQVKEKTCNP